MISSLYTAAHAADCWDLTVAELRRQAPEIRVLAVDLPGRGATPGDLETVSIADCVDSVVADVEGAGLTDVVVVGHSLAGVVVPGVVAKLGPARVHEMVMAATTPPLGAPPACGGGSSVVDNLGGPLGSYARWGAKMRRRPVKMNTAAARFAFCNGMTTEQRAFTLSRIYSDSVLLVTEPVDRSELPGDVARTWILTTRDRALPVRQQHASIRALGGVDTLIPIATCHDLMISEPKRLAAILVERCVVP
jgi:pimeloyl-ACP methyl ester carboxylesterase